MKFLIATSNEFVYKDIHKGINVVFNTPLIARSKSLQSMQKRIKKLEERDDNFDLIICDESIIEKDEEKKLYISNLLNLNEQDSKNMNICLINNEDKYNIDKDLSYLMNEDLISRLNSVFIPLINDIKDITYDCRTCINDNCFEDKNIYECDKYIGKRKVLKI